MSSVPAGGPADRTTPPWSRRSLLRGGTVLGVSAVTAAALPPTARRRAVLSASRQGGVLAGNRRPATHLALNYQPSQPTGWGQGFSPTVGGHTASLDFTYQATAYRISLLPFGQPGTAPDPVYEDVPADSAINFEKTLARAFGAYYSFRYARGFNGRNEFSVESYSVSVRQPSQTQPALTYGADIYVVYRPDRRRDDPAVHSNLQWIQVINWPQGPSRVSTVDNEGRANPFYVAGGLTSVYGSPVASFYDTPQIGVMGQAGTLSDHFKAEVFLAQDTGTRDTAGRDVVNIFGGVKYGWQVRSMP